MSLIQNRQAFRDYEILEKFEAGLELLGLEVKSLRGGQGSLIGSYVIVRGGEAFACNIDIPAYQEKNAPKGYEPKRNRKLLLSKAEIAKLADLEAKKGLTIVPVSVYSKGPKLKVEIAVARGKKAHDKKEALKERDVDREIRREHSAR